MTSKAGHTFTAGPWEYVPGTEHHGPYVTGPYGGDICDCYAMSNPMAASVRNGGTSYPINHQGEAAKANARLIAAAPELLAALERLVGAINYRDACSASGSSAPRIADASIRLTDAIDVSRAALSKATAGGAV